MRILYAVQGTGNGHLSRAMEVLPALQNRGEVDVLVSGTQVELHLPVPVKYRLHGLSFIFGKKGGIDFAETWRSNRVRRFWNEVSDLPVERYTHIISDFEPVSCWAAKLKKQHCLGLSNQLAVIAPEAPKPKERSTLGETVLRNYAPVNGGCGLHFQRYTSSICSPIIRRVVRETVAYDGGYYTVYLPAHSEEVILKVLLQLPDIQWQVFSKRCVAPHKVSNVTIQPINSQQFLESMAGCRGLITAGGFATPAEALYLKKKLLVIPMKNQYEQQCNAAALTQLGVPVLKSFKPKRIPQIIEWLESQDRVEVNYPDQTQEIVDKLLALQPNFQLLSRPVVRPTLNSFFEQGIQRLTPQFLSRYS
jgi:uncharacterized protein (TIGR00661 family)